MVVATSQPSARLSSLVAKLAAGNLAYLAAQFVVFVVLAQLSSTSEVGRFSWALALTSPIFTLADMRTQQVQMTTPTSRYAYRVFLNQRALALSAAVAVSLTIGYVSVPDAATRSTLLAVIALKAMEGMLNVVLGEHMRHEEMGRVALLQVVRSFVYAAAFVGLTVSTLRADYAAAAAAAALLIPTVVGHLTIPYELRKAPVRRRVIAALTRESFPLGIGFFVGSLTVNAPRFILEKYHGVDSLGVFAAVSYVVVLANTVVDSISQGVMPRFSSYWRKDLLTHLVRVTRRICVGVGAVGLLGVLASVLVGGPILGLLYGDEYRKGAGILAVLMLSATLQYIASVLRSVLIARGMRRGVFFVSLANMAATLTVALTAVPAIGAIAAAWSLVAGQVFQSGAYVVLFAKVTRNRRDVAG